MGAWRRAVVWMSAGLVVLSVLASLSPTIRASHDDGGSYCAGPAELEMLDLINDFRAGRGLEPLGMSRPLGAAATHKSQDMASQG